MSKDESLEAALEDWFEKPFNDLPEELQKRVVRAFLSQSLPLSWGDFIKPIIKLAKRPFDELPDNVQKQVKRAFCDESRNRYDQAESRNWYDQTPEDRRRRARHWDGLHDPEIQEEQRRLWELAGIERIAEIEEKIETWEAASDKEARDLDVKQKKLKKLKKKLRKAQEQCEWVLGSKSPITPNTKRNKELQADANSLAKAWRREGRRKFTKEDIAKSLAKNDKWNSITVDRITRILRVQW